jgi:tyrosinase
MQLVSGWSDFWLSGIDLAVGRAAVGGAMGVRKSVYALAAAELEGLREAFLAVMGLRDERGYQYHAGLHGLPLPIQCRHGDILFLPWHRAYQYFFELALQDRVPEVAIPWWDWTSAAAHQDGLPPTHAAQAREDGRPNPLFDSEVLLPPAELELVRERLPGSLTDDPPRTRRDPDLPDELPRDRTIRSILRAPTFSDFSFRLENVHNDVHVWVGSQPGVAEPVAGAKPPASRRCRRFRVWSSGISLRRRQIPPSEQDRTRPAPRRSQPLGCPRRSIHPPIAPASAIPAC